MIKTAIETPHDLKLKVLTERHAERRAVEIAYASSFTHCVIKNGLAPALTTLDKNGEEITIHARELIDDRRWTKFLVASTIELSWLAHNVGFVGYSYAGFLLTTDRYLAVKRRADRQLFRGWGLIAAINKSLDYKWATHNFYDSYAESEFGKVQMLRAYCREMGKSWNKNYTAEDRRTLLDQTYANAQRLIESRAFEAFEPLPSLPTGIDDLLAMPDSEEDSDE